MGCEIKSGVALFIDVGQAPRMKFLVAILDEMEYKPQENFVGIIPIKGKPIASTIERVFGKYELENNPFLSDTTYVAEGVHGYQSQALEAPVWN